MGLVLGGLWPILKWLSASGARRKSPSATVGEGEVNAILENAVGVIAPTQVAVQLDRQAIIQRATQNAERQSGKTSLRREAAKLLNSTARQVYGKGFSALSQRQKKVVMGNALETASDDGYLLLHLRHEVLTRYYEDVSVWKHLGLDRPPQPYGYMDYDQRPGRKADA